jgi:hypothetical protein
VIPAAHDQAVSTKCFKRNILKEETGKKYGLHRHHEESADQVTSRCSIVTKTVRNTLQVGGVPKIESIKYVYESFGTQTE